MINGVEGLFKIDENYIVDKAIININLPAVRSINQCGKSTKLDMVQVLCQMLEFLRPAFHQRLKSADLTLQLFQEVRLQFARQF